MSRVLVTGGSGFIGSHVVDRLVAAGHEPRILDVRPSPYRDDVETALGDICDVETMARASAGCDAVLHLAAAADVGEVKDDPVASERLNARGTAAVLEGARRAEVGRVVYASTIWVYSDVVADHVDEDTALVPPAHLYTATKLAGELYCRSYRELYQVESTILRFGIPYGPRARPAAVVPIFVRKALAGEPLTVAGGGLQSRRFVYVEDLAEGIVRGLAPVAADRTYNLVGTEDVTIRAIADRVREVVGNVEIVEVDGRAGDFRGAEISGERAERELGWRAETPFAEGLARYVAWHREHYAAESAVEAPVTVAVPVAPAPVRYATDPNSTAARLREWKRPATFVLLGLLLGLLTPPDPWFASVGDFVRDHVALTVLLAALIVGALTSAAVAYNARRRAGARA